jgi:hypothetical protein
MATGSATAAAVHVCRTEHLLLDWQAAVVDTCRTNDMSMSVRLNHGSDCMGLVFCRALELQQA